MDLISSKERQINDIMENFDFNKVCSVMNYLDWEYYNIGVPNIEQIKETAKSLLDDVYHKPAGYEMATGGFIAIKYKDGLRLIFEVEDWDSYNE